MSRNMPILWQNAIGQFSTEIAKKAWVWFAETRGSGMQYQADTYAREVDGLVQILRPLIEAANRPFDATGEVLDDLLRFILLRHANLRLGGNVSVTFLGGT